jgi:hypothetical protein
MIGYRKRTCPKCKKTSMWLGAVPLNDDESAAIEILMCVSDKRAMLAAMVGERDRQIEDTIKAVSSSTS